MPIQHNYVAGGHHGIGGDATNYDPGSNFDTAISEQKHYVGAGIKYQLANQFPH